MKLALSWRFSILNVLQVYFNMLDAFLAEEQIPDEYAGKTQVHHCFHSHTQTSIWYNASKYILIDYERNCRSYYAMIVRREEKQPSIGFTINALTVVHTTPGFYDSVSEWVGIIFSSSYFCVERWACINNLDFKPWDWVKVLFEKLLIVHEIIEIKFPLPYMLLLFKN